MRLIVDIDGTICSQEEDYIDAKPFIEKIKLFNERFDKGDEIIYYTARGTATGLNWRPVTEYQFEIWGVQYTELLFGKPFGDYYIDDKAVNIKDF